jgi:hypothetical protein
MIAVTMMTATASHQLARGLVREISNVRKIRDELRLSVRASPPLKFW